MNINKNIFTLLTACGIFAGCSDDVNPTYTVGKADNAIVLSAGISEGSAGVATRAVDPETNHGKHVLFKSGTKARLRVDGKWKKAATGEPTDVRQATTITLGGASSTTDPGKLHNVITDYDPQLYWDDYGTADPNNESVGRAQGLTIYGVAVDGYKNGDNFALPGELNIDDTPSNWTALSWNVGTPSTGANPTIDQTAGWVNYDLLTSNNVVYNADPEKDNAYKFSEHTTGKLLEFTHAMSKITVRLIAGEGFPTEGTGTVGNTTKKFKTAPEVTLTSNEGSATGTEWPFTSGKVDVTTGGVSNQGGSAKVKMHQGTVTDADKNTYTAIYDALVVPGSEFGAGSGTPAKYPIIARINADGNIYYVTSEAIRAAIKTLIDASKHNNDYKTESGKNYIITVTVNKTKIDVTATIKGWEDVEAAEVNPVINVGASYGGSNTTGLGKDDFSFYRSTSYDNGYSSGMAVGSYFPAEAVVKKPTSGTEWVFTNGTNNTPLYWSDHNTHYQMRGVWPLTGTGTGDVDYPRVETATHDGKEYQVIKVKNVAYEEGTFPSDLAIGRPDVATDATCHNSDHTAVNLYSGGICATEGTINLDFEYMMSKIEVNLSTTTGNDKVELDGAKVEVTNLYTTGEIRLGDRTAANLADKTLYELHTTSTADQFMDAIVPQTLTYTTAGAETNVRFKITITNKDAVYYADAGEYNADKGYDSDNPNYCTDFSTLTDEQKIKFPATQDVYYADVNPILKKDETPAVKVAPEGKWKSGKHYIYYLKLSKTKIDVTAKLTDWVTVEASENVWF